MKDVVNIIKESGVSLVVWTGGEPSLQMKEIQQVITSTPLIKHDIEINGTKCFTPKYFNRVVISPKQQKINMKILEKFSESNNIYFKFVVRTKSGFNFWFSKFVLFTSPQYFMPMGKSKESIEGVSEWLSKLCVEKNVNFTTRLHVLLWDGKRGV